MYCCWESTKWHRIQRALQWEKYSLLIEIFQLPKFSIWRNKIEPQQATCVVLLQMLRKLESFWCFPQSHQPLISDKTSKSMKLHFCLEKQRQKIFARAKKWKISLSCSIENTRGKSRWIMKVSWNFWSSKLLTSKTHTEKMKPFRSIKQRWLKTFIVFNPKTA